MELTENQRPVVYDSGYNIALCGIENLHPFDSKKWERVVNFLKEWEIVTDDIFVRPEVPSRSQFLKIHSENYLKSLEKSKKIAEIVEIPAVACLPYCLIESHLLNPLRLQTGGSLLAAELALKYKWAINIGGGFHHASYDSGGGFCFYADISLAIKNLLDDGRIQSAIIVDLDAHQGNGHARDFSQYDNVFILDIFNPKVYPQDREARQYINNPVYVDNHTTDQTYISYLCKNLAKSLSTQSFDLMIYNAGTDCLMGDRLGFMNLSPECIITRDELVFEMAKSKSIPICMVTSGGYQKNNAEIIAKSIKNLNDKKLIELL